MKEMLLIYNAHLVDANIDVKNGAILVCGSKIEGLVSKETVKKMLCDENVSCFNARGAVVMPAFVDMHAHFRDPGLTQKEDLESGSHAAAAGGFGTLVLMPNTSPVVSSLEMAIENNRKVSEMGLCDVFQTVSITENFDGKTISHLEKLNAKNVPVITEDGKEVMDSSVMLEAMKIAAKKKIIVSCHCEDPFLADAARPLRKEALALLEKNKKKEAAALLKQANEYLACAEDVSSYRNIRLAETAGCHVHLCHVSTAESLEAVRIAKKNGLNVTCEVTPHHIGLSGEKAPGIFNIVNPPLRSEDDRQSVIDALFDGTADCIGTDHAPHTEQDKKNGAPGFSGLETAFATCYTTLCRENGMKLKRLSELLSKNPAELLGLKNTGLLEEGYVANLVVVDTEKEWKVCGEEFASKGKFTPLEGKKLFGEVEATFHNGKIVFQN